MKIKWNIIFKLRRELKGSSFHNWGPNLDTTIPIQTHTLANTHFHLILVSYILIWKPISYIMWFWAKPTNPYLSKSSFLQKRKSQSQITSIIMFFNKNHTCTSMSIVRTHMQRKKVDTEIRIQRRNGMWKESELWKENGHVRSQDV